MRYQLPRSALLAILILTPWAAPAAVDFEGFYAVEIDGNPVGFSVQRNELEPATGIRKISYLLKTLRSANDLEQFVSLKQDKYGRPLSYHYDSRVRELESHVDGRAQGPVMTLNFRARGGAKDPQTLDLTPETFFSSSLGPILAAKKPAAGQAFSFEAISEEEGEKITGEVLVLDVKSVGERRVYRTVLRFQNLEQEAWFLDNGLTLRTESTSLPVRTTLVADGRAAVGVIERGQSLIAKYFTGRVAGTLNPVAAGLRIPDKLFPARRDLGGFTKTPRVPLGPAR